MFGDDDPQVVAGGHSNVACLINAHEAGLGPRGVRAAIAYPADFGTLEEDYWDFLADAASGRTVAVVWDGNQHNGAFLIEPEPPFRVYGESGAPGPPVAPSGQWVPREMLSTYWWESFAELGRAVERLLERSRVLVIGTPPPKPTEYIRAKLEGGNPDWDPWVADIASSRETPSPELPISPEPFRLALWSVIQDGMREQARRRGATFVPAPPAARDAAGLLIPDYSNGDLTHGNAQYGGLLWAQIEAALAPQP